jgi:hypothetical protein
VKAVAVALRMNKNAALQNAWALLVANFVERAG